VARRALTWTLTLPLVGVSVLVGHALAYRLTGTAPGSMHDYLGHAPQVLAVLAVVGLLGLAIDQRAERLATMPFAGLGLAVFAVQEHLERAAHTGDLPLLLADPAFLVGLSLQIPVGLVAVRIARRLAAVLDSAAPWPAGPPVVSTVPLVWSPVVRVPRRQLQPAATLGRGPPLYLRR
jgi:hypothetical protein